MDASIKKYSLLPFTALGKSELLRIFHVKTLLYFTSFLGSACATHKGEEGDVSPLALTFQICLVGVAG
jgi:hypothetical protein